MGLPTFASVLLVACVNVLAAPAAATPPALVSRAPNPWAPIAAIAARNESLVPWSVIRSGFDSLPLSADRQRSLVRFVRDSIGTLHAFSERSVRPPDPRIEVSVDIWAELTVIAARRYAAEWRLQADLVRLVNRLGDTHSSYRHTCFVGDGGPERPNADPIPVYYYQPLSFVAVVTGNPRRHIVLVHSLLDVATPRGTAPLQDVFFRRTTFVVSQSDPTALAAVRSAGSLAPLVGGELLFVNGRRAFDYFFAYARSDNIGRHKDKQATLNRLFVRHEKAYGRHTTGSWENRGSNHLPESDSVRYTVRLARGGKVTFVVPWLVDGFILNGLPRFQSPALYLHACLTFPRTQARLPDPRAGLVAAPRAGSTNATARPPGYFKTEKEGNQMRLPDTAPNSNLPPPAATEWFLEATILDKENLYMAVMARRRSGRIVARAGVIQFPGGMEPDPYFADMHDFAPMFASAFRNLTRRVERSNPTKLLVDVTGNGGGYPCFTLAVLYFFFPRARADPPVLDLRSSPWMQATAAAIERGKPPRTSGLWDYRSYGDLARKGQYMADQAAHPDGRWIRRTAVRSVPGTRRTLNVTQTVTYQCFAPDNPDSRSIDRAWFGRNVPATAAFLANKVDPKRVVVFGDGNCGSACAVFLRAMRRAGAKAVVSGGALQRTDFMPDAFQGGFVSDLSELLAASPVGSLGPAPPDGAASVRLVPVEALDWADGKTPLEFVYSPADARVHYEVPGVGLEQARAAIALPNLWARAMDMVWGE
ncbi:hypothetical protein DFJ74DRAFT_704155 [Hyaloraphidium curvatum]|nr:hypothetical protein DFJ74DRAFT_704155 [Hyaloraphidium curvatum]